MLQSRFNLHFLTVVSLFSTNYKTNMPFNNNQLPNNQHKALSFSFVPKLVNHAAILILFTLLILFLCLILSFP